MIRYIRKLKSRGGYSLIETIVALSIASLTVLASYSTLEIKQKTLKRGETVAAVQQEAVIVMKRIKRKVRESAASEVKIMSSETGWQTGPEGGDMLVFASARDNSSKFHIDSNEGTPQWQKTMVYCMDADSNSLLEYTEPWSEDTEIIPYAVKEEGTPIIRKLAPVKDGITPVKFQWDYYSPELLHVTIITGADAEIGGSVSTELTTSIRLRN